MRIRTLLLTGTFFACCLPLEWASSQELPLPIADLKRTDAVDFNKEIMPILRQKCLACHHAKEAEAGLNLERFSTVVSGGDSGDGILAGEPEESLVFTRAAGIEEPLMPPEDNNVGAAPLTPQELGLLRLWINQGAQGTDSDNAGLMEWDPIPESVRSVYALDVSADGRFAAFGRGNRAHVLELHDPSTSTKLADPKLGEDPVAAIDIIQSVAFSPTADRIAVGGFRTVRIWERQFDEVPVQASVLQRAHGPISVSRDQQKAALVNAIGDIELWDLAGFSLLHTLNGFSNEVVSIHWTDDAGEIAIVDVSGRVSLRNPATGAEVTSFALNESLTQVSWTADHSHFVVLTGERAAKLYSRPTNLENSEIAPGQLAERVFDFGDVTSVALIDQPVPSIVVVSEEKGVHSAPMDQLGNPTHLATDSKVLSITLSPDQSKIAMGTEQGTILLWNVAEAKVEATLQGTTEGQLLKQRFEWELQGQNATLAKLNGRTEGLKAALTKENEALKGATEARQKADEAHAGNFAAQTKAKETADATANMIAMAEKKVTESEATIKTAKDTLTKLGVRQEEEAKKLAAAKTELAKNTATVESTMAMIAELQKQLTEQRKAMESSAANVANSEKLVDSTKREMETNQKNISEAEKAIAEAKSMIDTKSKELEAQKKAITDADAKVAQSSDELAKRTQALAAATDAQQRAAAAIPAHQSLVEESTRMVQRIEKKQERAARQHDASSPVSHLALSPDGASLAVMLDNGEARVYRLKDGREVATYSVPEGDRCQGLCWYENSVVSWNSNAPSHVYNAAWSWAFVRQIGGIQEDVFPDRVTALAFDRTGSVLAAGSGEPSRTGLVKLFDSGTGQLLKELSQVHSDSVLGLSFSPDNRTLASAAADKTVRLTSVASGEVIRTLEGHTHHVLAVDWQEDGQQVMSASADKTVKVWDIESGRAIRTITGFPEELSAIDIVQGTHQVVAAGINGSVRLANGDNGKILRNFDAGGEFTFTVRATPDGQWLLAAGQSGKLRVWQLSDGKLVFEY